MRKHFEECSSYQRERERDGDVGKFASALTDFSDTQVMKKKSNNKKQLDKRLSDI